MCVCWNSSFFVTLSFGILEEDLETIDEVGAIERIATNAHAQRLSQSDLCCLVHSLVG